MEQGAQYRVAAAESGTTLKVLVVTSEWPSSERPHDVPFLVEQVEHLRAAGVEIEVFSFRGRANPLRYAAAWIRLRARHQLRSFDLVHAHFGQSGLVALPCPVPLVVTFHGSDLEGLRRADGRATPVGRLLRAVSRFVARRAAKVVVVSEHLQAILPAGVAAEVIPCGIDLEAFAPRPMAEARAALGLPGDGRLVLFAGDPANPIKRHGLAAEAVSKLGPEIEAQLITLHGKPHSQVPLFMNACDVLVLTSFHEGSPTVVKEALACGLPIVSVPVGDVVERVRGIAECRVCRTDDADEIAAAVAEVLRDSRRASAGTKAVAGLGHGSVTAQLVNLYRDFAEIRGRRND